MPRTLATDEYAELKAEMHVCCRCKQTFPRTVEFFVFHASGHIAGKCRRCRKEYDKERYDNRTEEEKRKHRQRSRAIYWANPAKRHAKTREWRKNNQDRTREHTRRARTKYVFGITRDEYNAKLASQGGSCALCGTTEPGGQGHWHLDHDHTTGKIRQFLCARCNLGLGYFNDDPGRLLLALNYLKKNGKE